MTNKTKERMYEAITNASEFIRCHVEAGLSPEDVNELDENGLNEYQKACERVSKYLDNLAKKYR